ADLEPVLVLRRLADLAQDPLVGRAEVGQRPGERVDEADHDVLGAAAAGGGGTAAGTLDARTAGLEQSAAAHDGGAGAGRAQQAPSADRPRQTPPLPWGSRPPGPL